MKRKKVQISRRTITVRADDALPLDAIRLSQAFARVHEAAKKNPGVLRAIPPWAEDNVGYTICSPRFILRTEPAGRGLDAPIAAATRGRNLRRRSNESYQSNVERHLTEWLDMPLREICREMVEAKHEQIAAAVTRQFATMAKDNAAKHRQRAAKAAKLGWGDAAAAHEARAKAAATRPPPSGHATANGAMRALRLLYNFALDRDATLPPNPVRLTRQWFAQPRRTRLVKADDLPALYEAVQKLENSVQRDYVLLLLYTGLRRREAATLRWDDVDFKAGVVRIPAARTKANRAFDLPMTDTVRDLLVSRRALGNSEFVFPANSASGHVEEPKFAFDLIRQTTGITVSPHDLRRTFVTVAESTDISPIALKALVNHSVGNDVTGGYVVMSVERLREAAQKVTDAMKALCGVAPLPREVTKLR